MRFSTPLFFALIFTAFVTCPPFAQATATNDDAPPQLISTTGGNGSPYDTPAKLKQAATNGDAEACYRLTEELLEGSSEFPQDIPRALTLLQQAADVGHPAANFRLGRLLDHGQHLDEDPVLAREHYRTAATSGHVEAQYNLGIISARGRGGPKDYTEALAWLMLATRAGAQGDAEQKLRDFLKRRKDSAALFTAAEKLAEKIKANYATGPVSKVTPTAPPTPLKPAILLTPPKVQIDPAIEKFQLLPPSPTGPVILLPEKRRPQ